MIRQLQLRKLKLLYPLCLALFVGLVGGAVMINNNQAVGDQLRVYRIAIAATGEFTAHHGGTKAGALAAIKDIVSEVNKVYEPELSIRLQLVSDMDQNKIIYTNAGSDPYSTNDRSANLTENQSTLDAEILSANYDIGHVFGKVGSGGGGLAGLGVVGDSNSKARGVSEASDPSASSKGFIGVLLHEIGHQFGAQHTFNADAIGSCATNRTPTNAYEPSSGSTLMSYAGICGSDNLQLQEDFYFHAASFEQINEYIENNVDATPFQSISTGNAIPTVDGGADYIIPANTPFELTATGSDVNGDSLTYTWEQLDLGASMGLPLSDNGFSPLFRSFPPSSNPTRTFPRLTDLIANTIDPGEVLPTMDRDLNFRVTVRDNKAAGGGVFSNDVYLDVRNTGSAFAVTAPNGGGSFTGGASMPISWAIAGTTANGINASQVNILLSTNGGESFPFLLATVANNGSTSITVPNISTTQARIKIQGAGNIFFDISDNNFSIAANPAVAGVSIMESGGSTVVNESGIIDFYQVALNVAPASSVTVMATSDDQSELSTDGATYASSVSLTFNSTASQSVYVRAIDDAEIEGGHTSTISHVVTTGDGAGYPTSLLINEVIAQVVDDEALAVVGIDFDFDVSQPSPSQWTTFQVAANFDPQVVSDMQRDDGVATGIDLTLEYDSGGLSTGRSTAGAGSLSKPFHVPSLEEIDGFHRGTLPMSATWSDLIPGRSYGVYVFGLDNDNTAALGQTITITGATSLPTFTQTLGEGDLHVNEMTGSSAQDLTFYEKVVAADANGEILVRLVPTGDGLGLAGMALREILPSTPGITVSQLALTEGGSTGTYEFNLNTDPNGTLTVSVEADADTEVSLDGVSFADSQSVTLSNTLPQIITVRAVDDAFVEGVHDSSIGHVITSSTSASYPVSLALVSALVTITDNDASAPLAGVDFDIAPITNPTNWTNLVAWPTTLTDLMLEDGTSTSIDLTIANGGGGFSHGGVSPSSGTVPLHSPELSGVDHVFLHPATSGAITFTWKQLTIDKSYNVYVFGLENFGGITIDQTVTVTGQGSPVVFSQVTTTGSELWVNDKVGSSSSSLEAYAVQVVANGSGEITASIVANSGDWVCLAAVAIQEAPIAPSVTVDTGDGVAVSEGSGTDTYMVALDSTPSAAVNITVTADAQSEVSLDGVTFASTRVFTRSDTGAQTITVRAIDDSTNEGAHTSRITHAVTSSGDMANYPLSTFIRTVTAVITDNDSVVSIVANDASGAEPSDDAQFTVSLSTGDVAPTGGVAINFTVSGTATNGVDYAMVNSPLTIPGGSNSATIAIDVSNDGDSELPESVVITLNSTSDANISVASGPNDVATAIITSDEQSEFQTWQVGAFSLDDLTDPTKEATLWGAEADADDDGIQNLAEFFHNLLPNSNDGPPVSSTIIEDTGVEYLQMVYRRRKNLGGVQQVIQDGATPAAASWQTATAATESTTTIDGNTDEVTVRYPTGILLRRFLRFRIILN